MNIALCNLGCSKNQVDGEHILGWLRAAGHAVVRDYETADAILINTCAFIQQAREEAIQSILELARHRREGRCRILAVCGCFSERYRGEAARSLPEVDYWFGVHTWREEMSAVFGRPTSKAPQRLLTQPLISQYVKIAEGCSRRCSFCAIPAIRGPLCSRRYKDILAEVRWLERRGARECILVSQDTSAWGRDTNDTLLALIERLLRLMQQEPRLCSYLDIPLQHIAERVLRGMRRSPGGRKIRALIERIRALAPDAAIRSSFIVGFPGEGESEFRELLDFILWARLERVGVFEFSPEEGTAAFRMRPRPRPSTARRRSGELMALQHDISARTARGRIGATLKVLIESGSASRPGHAEGRSQWDAPEVDGVVYVKGSALPPGSFAAVRVERADAYDLYGTALD